MVATEHIVWLASLGCKGYDWEDEWEIEAFKNGLAVLGRDDQEMVLMVLKLMSGEPYDLVGFNPACTRHVSVARELGALIEDNDDHPSLERLGRMGMVDMRAIRISLLRH
jgi:hypothetical protein